MQQELYQTITSELGTLVGKQAIELAELRALCSAQTADLNQVQQQLAEFQQVLDASPELAALFNEEKAKIQGGQA